MQDIDRLAEANQAIDRRARQRHAAALAQQQLTPEAIAAEEERQRNLNVLNPPDDNHTAESLQDKFAHALTEVVSEEPPESQGLLGLGRLVFQWVLAENVEDGGHQLALQIQVDEQPPAGFVADITPQLLAQWAKGKGLQGNRTEHKHFAAGLFDRAIAVGATETANHLIYLLEELMLDTEPTRTSVRDDDDYFGPGIDGLKLSPEGYDLVSNYEPALPELSE